MSKAAGGKDSITAMDLLASTPKHSLKGGSVPGRVKFPTPIQHQEPLLRVIYLVLHPATISTIVEDKPQIVGLELYALSETQ
jgi:hypothetical protein